MCPAFQVHDIVVSLSGAGSVVRSAWFCSAGMPMRKRISENPASPLPWRGWARTVPLRVVCSSAVPLLLAPVPSSKSSIATPPPW